MYNDIAKNNFWHFQHEFVLGAILQIPFFVCQNVISITCKKRAVSVQYKNKKIYCCFCDSYPNDGTQYDNTTNITELPDKITFNMAKNQSKIPKKERLSGIRRPGVGIGGWCQGGPGGLSYQNFQYLRNFVASSL